MLPLCTHAEHASGDDVPLLLSIDVPRLSCLNEAVSGSCAAILRPHCARAR